jgi:hypothetical protein
MLTYEGLYDFLKRPRALRIHLRRIQQRLMSITPPTVLSDKPSIADRRMHIWAYLRECLPALRSAYDGMLIFAEHVTTHISAIKEEAVHVPVDLLTKWKSCGKDDKKRIVVELFEQGMTTKDERFLDKTHFTQHLITLRSLINIAAGQAFCHHLGEFGKGLHEMRDMLDFKLGEAK